MLYKSIFIDTFPFFHHHGTLLEAFTDSNSQWENSNMYKGRNVYLKPSLFIDFEEPTIQNSGTDNSGMNIEHDDICSSKKHFR